MKELVQRILEDREESLRLKHPFIARSSGKSLSTGAMVYKLRVEINLLKDLLAEPEGTSFIKSMHDSMAVIKNTADKNPSKED